MNFISPQATSDVMVALSAQPPNNVNTQSVFGALQFMQGSLPGKSQSTIQLTGNGATSINLFQLQGSGLIYNLLGSLIVTDSTTFSGVYFDLWDGTTSVPITDSGTAPDFSGVPSKSLIVKTADETVDLKLLKSDQVRIASIDSIYDGAFYFIQKDGQTTYLRINFTGDANTDIQASLSLGMFLTANGDIQPVTP